LSGQALPPPPALLFIGTFLPHNVASRAVSEDIAERLSQRGWATALTSRRRARLPRLLDLIATVCTTRATVAHIDVYSGAAFRTAEVAARLLTLRGIAYAATLHGGHLPVWRERHRSRLRRVLRGAAAVVAPSPWLARELADDRADIEVIPNGIVLPGQARPLPEQLVPRVGWLRAFDPTYRPELAVNVAATVCRQLPRAHLEMVGPDKGARAGTEALVEVLGLGAQVTLGAGVEKHQVGNLVAGWEVFLSTSAIDNAPVTVVEAMAAGRPVVCARVGGLADLLDHGVEGLLVDGEGPALVAGLAAAVVRLTTEVGLASRLGAAGQQRAARHAWDVVIPRWETLFAQVANASRSRR
jgi:glycosyltransferase involved in cell wall biosynthesis